MMKNKKYIFTPTDTFVVSLVPLKLQHSNNIYLPALSVPPVVLPPVTSSSILKHPINNRLFLAGLLFGSFLAGILVGFFLAPQPEINVLITLPENPIDFNSHDLYFICCLVGVSLGAIVAIGLRVYYLHYAFRN